VKKLDNSKVYALKETNVRKMSQEERADAVNEIRLLASVQHQHIITYHEAFIDGNRLCIIMEYAQNGDLARAIRKRASQCRPFPEDLIWSYFIQIVRALQALHAKRILHRDVKSGNVLRVDEGTVKLGDLGIAKLMKHNMTKTQIGTPHYMPPEVWRNKPYSFSSDIWSLGCLLYELCTFNVPFPARDMKELRFKVLKGKLNPIPRAYSSDLSDMIRFLMQPNASERPSADEILSFDVVQRRMHLAPSGSESYQEIKNALLNTIKVPKNFRLVAKRLPKPFYPDAITRASCEDAEAAERLRAGAKPKAKQGASGNDNNKNGFSTAASWPRRVPCASAEPAGGHLPPIDARSAVSSPGHMHRQGFSSKTDSAGSSPHSVNEEVQSKHQQHVDSSIGGGRKCGGRYERVHVHGNGGNPSHHHNQHQQHQQQQNHHHYQHQQHRGHLQYQKNANRRSYDTSCSSHAHGHEMNQHKNKLARMSYDNHNSYSHYQHQPGCFPWNNPISQVSAAAAEAASRIGSVSASHNGGCYASSASSYSAYHGKVPKSSSSYYDMDSPEQQCGSNVKIRHHHRYKRVCPLPPILSQGAVDVNSRYYQASVY